MQISSDHILIHNTFITAFTIISGSVQNLSERFISIQISSSAMVFKSYYRHVYKFTVQNDIIDQTSFFLLRIDIHQIQALDHSGICFIVLPKKLITAAHCDDHTAVFYIIFEFTLDLQKTFTHDCLFPVGTASQQNDIQF